MICEDGEANVFSGGSDAASRRREVCVSPSLFNELKLRLVKREEGLAVDSEPSSWRHSPGRTLCQPQGRTGADVSCVKREGEPRREGAMAVSKRPGGRETFQNGLEKQDSWDLHQRLIKPN